MYVNFLVYNSKLMNYKTGLKGAVLYMDFGLLGTPFGIMSLFGM